MVHDGTDRLGFLIHDVARLLRRRFERRGGAHGLSAAQWRVLVRVAKEEGMTQARLADILEVEPISVSRLLDRMEDAGWIERRFDASDRRVRVIFPTERSRAVYGEVKAIAGEVYEEALAGFSPEQRRGLIEALDAIAANLAESEAAPETDRQTDSREKARA